MPDWIPDDRDRYQLEFEMRHSHKTLTIGSAFKLVVTLDDDVPES